jgi:hypothetical protein
MVLTTKQKKLQKQAKRMAKLAQIDFWNIKKKEKEGRRTLLEIAINNIAVSIVIGRYTLFDEILADCICQFYFKTDPEKPFINWEDDKYRIFVNYLLDEMYLLKKTEVVHAIEPIPSHVRRIINKVNALRNSMAHSFFPENRKEHRKDGKVLYDGKDIRTAKGITAFLDDCGEAWSYLARRAFGEWNGVNEGDGKWDTKEEKDAKP